MDVIIHDNFFYGQLVLKEIIQFLRQVKYNGNTENQHDREKERAEKLLDNIPVKRFHSLVIIWGKMASFHTLKSPARICCRASVTKSR